MKQKEYKLKKEALDYVIVGAMGLLWTGALYLTFEPYFKLGKKQHYYFAKSDNLERILKEK